MWLFQCTNVIEKNDYIPGWHPATNKTRKDFCELFPQYQMVVVIVVIMAIMQLKHAEAEDGGGQAC